MREFELLQHVFAASRDLGGQVLIPPGDDMALLQLAGGRLLAGVDQLVAGRHFDLDATPLDLVGRKAVSRALSDIAAMAARPLATLAAVTLPPDFGDERAKRLFDAMRITAERYRCPLVGGDLAVHGDPTHPLVCSVTVLAEPAATQPITRAGATVGDIVYVTGALGGSFGADGRGRHPAAAYPGHCEPAWPVWHPISPQKPRNLRESPVSPHRSPAIPAGYRR